MRTVTCPGEGLQRPHYHLLPLGLAQIHQRIYDFDISYHYVRRLAFLA